MPIVRTTEQIIEKSVLWIVLGILLTYTYAELGVAPYIGFSFNPTDGQILHVFVETESTVDLLPGDFIQQVDALPWKTFRANSRQPLLEDKSTGDTVTLIINREGKLLTLPWLLPGMSLRELRDRVFNVWIIAYIFWLFGAATVLLIRPKSLRWYLLIGFNFITAIWLVVGNMSRWHLWEGAIIVRMVTWLAVPIYLHLHWILFGKLRRLHSAFWTGMYLFCLLLAMLEVYEILPRRLYYSGFVVAVMGGMVLLVIQTISSPRLFLGSRLITVAIILAAMPLITLSVNQMTTSAQTYGGFGLLSMPIIPASYFYLGYKKQLGDVEIRANRLLTLYMYLLVLLSLVSVVMSFGMTIANSLSERILLGILVASLAGALSVLYFPSFQRWVEYHLLGIPLIPEQLLEDFALRISKSPDIPGVVRLLKDDVLPTLLIRQSALFQFKNNHILAPEYVEGISSAYLPEADELTSLLKQAEHDQNQISSSLPWVNVTYVLQIEDKHFAVWLLGKRDPDDFYSIKLKRQLHVLASYTGIALSRIEMASRLLQLHQAGIKQYYMEKNELARILHDQVLGQLTIMSLYENGGDHSPEFDTAYDSLVEQLRDIIKNLRPIMLGYGLYSGLMELVDKLSKNSNGGLDIRFDIPPSDVRYVSEVEQHIYGIVELACDNVLRHAHATTLHIRGWIEANAVDLIIEDNGIGFSIDPQAQMPELLANNHFGLVHMTERAALIDATVGVESMPGQGTVVQIQWKSKESDQDLCSY